MPDISIRLAAPGDGQRLSRLEARAAKLFREIGMDAIADAPPTPAKSYETFIAQDRVYIAAIGKTLAGFLAWEMRDGYQFIYEVSVDPDFQGRRIAAQLIDRLKRPSLSCFTDVPWNAPYYQKLGFRSVQPAALGPDHMAVAADEKRRFAPWPRCFMAQ